jgi:phage tail-like protein
VRKVPGIHKVSDVTLKRGIVNSSDLWTWISQTRNEGVAAKRTIVITLRDEAGNPVQKWTLGNVVPMKYTGPTLAAKGGGDVAMEELVLSSESLEAEQLG